MLRTLPRLLLLRLVPATALAALAAAGCGGGGHAAGPSPATTARLAPSDVAVLDAAQRLCSGAAARDAQRPCTPRDPLAVKPTPDDAILQPNAPCKPLGRVDVLYPCAFGEPSGTERIALVGDSHASHWRAAVAVVARARRYQAISLARTSCPFSVAVTVLPQPERAQCIRWNNEVHQWFRKNRDVHTMFVSEHSGGRVVLHNGRSTRETQISGYLAAWKALPRSVTRIWVIRDTPRNGSETAGCVQRAIADREPAGERCAVPRSRALKPDPAVAAAARMPGDRVRVIDLTSLLCSSATCFPVIGGVLVHKDVDHLTEAFAATLGPYLLRAIGTDGR